MTRPGHHHGVLLGCFSTLKKYLTVRSFMGTSTADP